MVGTSNKSVPEMAIEFMVMNKNRSFHETTNQRRVDMTLRLVFLVIVMYIYIYIHRERWGYKLTNINIHKCIIASNPIPDNMKFICMADMSPF